MIKHLELLRSLAARLKENPQISSPELEAKWIIERAVAIAGRADMTFIESATQKRLQGQPLAYVLGEKEFYSLNFMVNPAVLIPRPETEILAELAIKWIKKQTLPTVRVLDLGAGSGCIGLTLAKLCLQVHLCSVDISGEALQVVDYNSKNLGVDARTQILKIDAGSLRPEDLPTEFAGQVDVAVANPPYIDVEDIEVDPWVRQHEPELALFSDEMGLGHLRRWLQMLPSVLTANGAAFFEIGYTQAKAAKEIVEQLQPRFTCRVEQDYSGKDRILCIGRKI